MPELSKFEDEILELINYRDDFTTSDLQGVVTVIVSKIYQLGKNDYIKASRGE